MSTSSVSFFLSRISIFFQTKDHKIMESTELARKKFLQTLLKLTKDKLSSLKAEYFQVYLYSLILFLFFFLMIGKCNIP